MHNLLSKLTELEETNSVLFLYSKHLPDQSQLFENFWNMFKVNNKDTRAMSMTSFGCLDC